MKILKEQIKTNKLKNIYLFFGEEQFLVNKYIEQIKNLIVDKNLEQMNFSFFEGDKCNVLDIANAIDTLPFFSEKRLIVVKNSKLFVSGRKENTEFISSIIDKVPSSTIVVFAEQDIDKRIKLYKNIVSVGQIVEFKTLSENELISWVSSNFKKMGLIIDNQTSIFFLRTVSTDMAIIHNEMIKLRDYIGKISINQTITKNDIEQICTKSLDTKIFDLINAIAHNNIKTALEIFSNLMLMKESPIMVIHMIARHFKLTLQCATLKYKHFSLAEISQKAGLRTFQVSEYLEQAKKINNKQLETGIKDCLETDISIKTGMINDVIALESLIIKYCNLT